MARPLRVDIENGWYHVICRGIERRCIFTDARDHEHFIELLEMVVDRFRVRLHAYALMGNHFHLLFETPDANLSQVMQWLKLSYSAWFNARHDRVGPLFQGRFKSVPVENSSWAYELSLYIHLNPVMLTSLGLSKSSKKAEAVGWKVPNKEQVKRRLEELRSFRWSSYQYYAGYRKAPEWLTVVSVLSRASKDKGKLQQAYRRDVKQRVTKGLPEDFTARLKEGFVLGTEGFKNKIRAYGKSGREIASKSQLRRRVSFDDVVQAVEKVRGVKLAEFITRRGDEGRPLLIWGCRVYAGLTLREIGDHFGGRDYAAISVMLKRFERRLDSDRESSGMVTRLKKELLNVET